MASNLACIGLDVPEPDGIDRLLRRIMPEAEVIARDGDVAVHLWQDPGGARVIVSTVGRTIADLMPSFAGTPGARFTDCVPVNDEVATAVVVDADGAQVSALAVELEQRRALAGAAPASGDAVVVALGIDVRVFADEAAFAASPASLVDPGTVDGPRMAAESVFSYGVLAEGGADTQAFARFSGTVLAAERRTTALSGQSFVAARARTAGFEVDVCLPGVFAAEIPPAGAVISGNVFVVASLPDLGSGSTARRWRRRR